MIVDTSARVAIVVGEPGWKKLREALDDVSLSIPASVLVELHLVLGNRTSQDREVAAALIKTLSDNGMKVLSFEWRHAILTQTARDRFGKGNGAGGLLNFGDIMVYAVAMDRGEPLLFTGRDFPTTDVLIHPASRIDN